MDLSRRGTLVGEIIIERHWKCGEEGNETIIKVDPNTFGLFPIRESKQDRRCYDVMKIRL
jgi:hypothetical protein